VKKFVFVKYKGATGKSGPARKSGIARKFVATLDDEYAYLPRAYAYEVNECGTGGFYAYFFRRLTNQTVIFLHQEIAGVGPNDRCYFKDGNCLNLRKENIGIGHSPFAGVRRAAGSKVKDEQAAA
jgi:hypothetical protein